jgi:hypothetical protein
MRDQWGMSNILKVSLQATIYSLHDRGWSRRRIARELEIDWAVFAVGKTSHFDRRQKHWAKESMRALGRSHHG